MRLDDPVVAVNRLAPCVLSTHVKDCGVLAFRPARASLAGVDRSVRGALPMPDLLAPLIDANPCAEPLDRASPANLRPVTASVGGTVGDQGISQSGLADPPARDRGSGLRPLGAIERLTGGHISTFSAQGLPWCSFALRADAEPVSKPRTEPIARTLLIHSREVPERMKIPASREPQELSARTKVQ